MKTRTLLGSALAALCAHPFTHHIARAENAAAEFEAPSVEVIGTTPVQGIGVPINQVPANVQAVTSKDIQSQRTLDLSEYLDTNLGNVSINQGQNNPFQPDIYFRGMTASPLLGTPQGLSVYFDGVRINEPFGDVVNWDLIPQNAISTVNLIPGSNPVFGLNTLGAALSVNTKSGFQYPGGSASLYGGSWGRKALEAEYGGHKGEWDWFVAGNAFKEDGWRDHSPSDVRQLFAKFGHETAENDFDVSLLLADNDLQGTQALPVSWLNTREQAYTWPDRNQNQVQSLNARGSMFLSAEQLIAGNIYLRHYKNTNTSSNVNDEYNGTDQVTCDGTGDGACTAINDRSIIDTDGYGAAVQYSLLSPLAGMKNALSVGLTADLGKTNFKQFDQEALFSADRSAVGQDEFELHTDAETTTHYYGLYATDTLSVSDQLHVTLSGRLNRAKVKIEDKTGSLPQLNGNHTFTRFNPAIGVNYNPQPTLTTYAAYSEGMRAPTALELTCADPNAPCRLPNNFLADPPLQKVVAKTLEIGARGKISDALRWSVAAYRTDLKNDIVFISSGGAIANTGYFANIPKTRRQGFEMGVNGAAHHLHYALNYGYTASTFESDLTINSPNNSTADGGGDIQVRPGDKIPAIPQHTAKLRLAYEGADVFSIGTSVVYSGSQYARGDENNQDVNGKVSGYTLIHLDGSFNVTPDFSLFFRVHNLLDKEYETFGILGENFFNGPNRTFDKNLESAEQFRSAGAPRAFWVGIRYDFGGRKSGAATPGKDD